MHRSDPPSPDQFKHELIEQAYRHLPASLFANLSLSLLVVTSLFNKADNKSLFVWLAIIWSLSFIRACALRLYNHTATEEKGQPKWGLILSLSVLFSGVLWGLSPFFISSGGSIAHQIFLVFVIGGLIAGATTSLASVQKTYRAFVLLVALPVTIKFFMVSGETHIPMAIMLIIFMVLCMIMSSHVQKMFLVSLKLRRENREAQKLILQQERLAAIGKLAGGVAHDLRNPLGSISNSVYFLKHKITDQADNKVERHLQLLDREVERANNIISALLDMSVNHSPDLERGDVNFVIKRLVEDFKIPDNIDLNLSLDNKVPLFRFDRNQFNRVLTNLVNNALQAMPEGGKLSISTTTLNNTLMLKVRDTGSGIEEEDISRIFEPLFTTKPKGVGLGLSIVKTLVEKHSGHVDAASVPGEGTTITVIMPMNL